MSESSFWHGKWVPRALFASVALNCLLAGLIVGRESHLFEHEKPVAAQGFPASGFSARVQTLSEDQRRKYNMAMKPFRPALRAARADLIAAREHMNQVLNAEPYDLPAVKVALADLQQKSAAYQQQTQDATAEALAELTPESRHMLIGAGPPQP